jgi:hypothetical protein
MFNAVASPSRETPGFHARNSVTALRTFLAQVDFPHRGRRNRDKLCLCMSALVEMSTLVAFRGFNAISS